MVVLGIADEEDVAPAQGRRLRHAPLHQRPGDALPTKGRVDGDRTQQQHRHAVELHRPEPDGAEQPLAVPCHEAELAERLQADAVAVRDLPPPVGAERGVEEGVDGGPVMRALGNDLEQGGLRGGTGETPSPGREA